MSLKHWMLALVSLFSLSSFAQFEESLKTHEALISFMNARQCEIGIVPNCNKPLSVSDIQKLKGLFRDLADWKRDIFEPTVENNDWLRGQKFEVKKGYSHKVETGRILKITLAEDSKEEVKKLKVATATYLVMYDNFLKITNLFAKAKKLRNIIASDMGSDGKLFFETFSAAADENYWKRTETLVTFLGKLGGIITFEHNNFDQYIASSFTGNSMREGDVLFKIKSILLVRATMSESQFLDRLEKVAGLLSKIFGNSVGTIQLRDGKMKKLAKDEKFMTTLKRKLRPLDILFEKTPFRLTDHFIPGFYGHVAIWLGTPEELVSMKVNYQGREIPLLDHPSVLPHLQKLSERKLVAEALREPGVTMNTLEHFMDIDDLLIMKPEDVSDVGEHVLRTFQDIGKPYDFNFDVETEGSIVCSELIYRTFNEHEWPVQRDVGRYTISPDHVAWKAVDSCFEPKVLFHDGKEVNGNMKAELKRLLSSESGISYTPDSYHPCQNQ